MNNIAQDFAYIKQDITYNGYRQLANRAIGIIEARECLHQALVEFVDFLQRNVSVEMLTDLVVFGYKIYEATHPTLECPESLKPSYANIHHFVRDAAKLAIKPVRLIRDTSVHSTSTYRQVLEQATMSNINKGALDVLFGYTSFYQHSFHGNKFSNDEKDIISFVEEGIFGAKIKGELDDLRELIDHILSYHACTEAQTRRYIYTLGLLTQFEILVMGYMSDYAVYMSRPNNTTTNFIRSLARNVRRIIFPIRPTLTWIALDLLGTSHAQHRSILVRIAEQTLKHQKAFNKRKN